MTTSVSLANIATRIDMLEIRCGRCDRAGPLKPSGLVDDIAQRLAPGESSAIVEQNIEPTVVDAGESIDTVGQRIFERLIEVASGDPTKSEEYGFGDDEFVPWQIGAVM